MSLWAKLTLWALGGIGLLIGVAIWSVRSILDGMCTNEVLNTIRSPDETLKVVVFQRDCGATTGFSTQVSLLRQKDGLPNSPGNLFVADTDRGNAPSGPGGGPEARISWANSRSLLISYHKKARIFQANTDVLGVSVSYATFN